MAKGFHQAADVDYTETSNPVVKSITIRVLLTLAIACGWSIRQVDINNAFLHGILHETVYMDQPSGFVLKGSDRLVCSLKKVLYGLKHAPRAWFERLSIFLNSLGFVHSKSDPSLLIWLFGGHCYYILIYVDDIVITGSSNHEISKLVDLLHQQFSLIDLGLMSYFFGIEISYPSTGGLYLSHAKYITDLLHKAKMFDARAISTPMVSGILVSSRHGDKFQDVHLYRSIVGALQYVTLTQLEIAFSVNKACQFMHSPIHLQWQLVKRILRYLKGTYNHGLFLAKPSDLSLHGYADADPTQMTVNPRLDSVSSLAVILLSGALRNKE